VIRRRHGNRHASWVSIGAATTLSLLLLCARPGQASAAFSMTMTVSAVSQSAVMPAGKPPVVTVLQGSVRLDWGPSVFVSGREVGGYILNRQQLGSTTVVQVCTVVSPFRTCQDSPPAGQQVVYTVIPTQGLWRGPASAPSSPITTPAAPVAAPTGAAAPSPFPSLGPILSATPTPRSTLPKPLPSPTPTPTPAATASASPH
jgi:hypothetical protein